MKLYELTNDFNQLFLLAEDAVTPEEQTAFLDTLEGLEGEIQTKLLGCARVHRTLESEAAAVLAEIDRLQKRSKTLMNSAEHLKAYMFGNMQASGLAKVKDSAFTLSIVKNPAGVIVDDEKAVPDVYKVVTVKAPLSLFEVRRLPGGEVQVHVGALWCPVDPQVAKTEIKEVLKSGQTLPGVHLEQGERLSIR